MSTGNRAIKHFLIISGGTLLNLIIGICTTPIITRLVEPNEYGQLSIFKMYAGFGVMILCCGLDQALVRFYYKSDDPGYKKNLLNRCLMVPLFIWCIGICIFIALYVSKTISFEFNLKISLILGLCIAFELIDRIGVLVVRLEYHSKRYTIVNILQRLSYTVSAIILINLYNKDHFFILASSTTFSYFISSLCSIIMEKKVWCVKSTIKPSLCIKTRQLIKFGAPFILSMGMTTLFQGIDKIALNIYCTYSEVGIYSSTISLMQVFSILQSSFNALWAPMATEHYEKDKSNKAFYQKGNAYITFLMFGFGLTLILCKDIFAILLGSKYRQAAYILPCLIFNPIMYTISETTVSGINFTERSYLHIYVAIGACITNVIGNSLLVPSLGGKGAAISTGLAYIVFFALRTMLSNKYYPVDFKLKKFYMLTTVVFMYALYNMFVPFCLGTVLGFVICMILLLTLYRVEALECFGIIVRKIQGINKK